MLEQALEQMDGIIQGAKYELPQYFETFSLQVGPSHLVCILLKSVLTLILFSGLSSSKLLSFCQQYQRCAENPEESHPRLRQRCADGH